MYIAYILYIDDAQVLELYVQTIGTVNELINNGVGCYIRRQR